MSRLAVHFLTESLFYEPCATRGKLDGIVYTLMCFCLLLLVSVRLAFSSCVIALFFTWFVLRFTSFS